MIEQSQARQRDWPHVERPACEDEDREVVRERLGLEPRVHDRRERAVERAR